MKGLLAPHRGGLPTHWGLGPNQLSQVHRRRGEQGLDQHVAPAPALGPGQAMADLDVGEYQFDELLAFP